MEIKFDNVSYVDPITKDTILKDLNFTILNNSISSFVGPSGSGKSTILELMETLKFATSGNVKIGDSLVSKKTPILNGQIGFVYQDPSQQFFMETVREELEFALQNFSLKNKEKRISDSLKMVGLDNSYLERNPLDLSVGEQKKLGLAIVLAFNPKIILLDEPTLGLDSKARNYIIKLIKMMKMRYKKTIVIASNDVDMLLKISDNVFLINKGKLIKQGDKYSIFGDYELLNKYGIEMPKTIYFSYLVKEKKKINIGYRDEINDLLKDVYRYVK